MNAVPLFGYISYFAYPFSDWWTFELPFFGIPNNAVTMNNAVYKALCEHMFLFLLGIYLGVKLLDHMNCQIFLSKVVWPFFITLQAMCEGSSFPLFANACYYVSDLNSRCDILVSMKWYLVILICALLLNGT